MSQADLLSREKSGIFSCGCARVEPSHVAATTGASSAPTTRLIRSSAVPLVAGCSAFAEFVSDMVTSLAQSGGRMILAGGAAILKVGHLGGSHSIFWVF